MSTISDASTTTIPLLYFEALESGDLSRIPYAEHVQMFAPLGPRGLAEPIIGAAAVRTFLAGVTPIIERVEVLNVFESGDWCAGRARIRLSSPTNAVLSVFDVFRVLDDRIVFQENHYDPRPALADDREESPTRG
jgi:hypothetical protein